MPGGKLKRKGTRSRTVSAKKKDKLVSSAKAIGIALASAKRPKSSPQEDKLAGMLTDAGLGGFKKEFRFHETRRWLFDFAWPDLLVAMEYEGMFGGRSRHLSFKGYTADCTKYSEAAILGWTVVRVTAPMVRDGTAIDLITRAIETKQEIMDHED